MSGSSMTADLANLAQVPDMVRQVRAMVEAAMVSDGLDRELTRRAGEPALATA